MVQLKGDEPGAIRNVHYRAGDRIYEAGNRADGVSLTFDTLMYASPELRNSIPKSIAGAEVNFSFQSPLREAIDSLGDELRFVLLTSEARVGGLDEAPAAAERIRLDEGEVALTVTPSEHQKCVRCWHYRADVGSDPEHPELCGRCVENVAGAGETRRVA